MRVTLSQGLAWLDAPALAPRADDAALAVQAAAGDAQAARALYHRHGPRIRRFLGDLLRDPALADDATQETFARVFCRLDSLDDPNKLTSWLFGVARNVSLEMMKARARRAKVFVEVSADAPSPEVSPERRILGREAAAILERAIAKLSEGRRAALLMRVDHQLAYGEIAQALGWSVAKAKVEVFRAREVLRATLEAEGEVP